MILHWQYNDEWHEQDAINMMQQDAHAVLAMLSGKIPSYMEIDGGYICSKSIYPKIRRKHKQVATYDTLLKKCQQYAMKFHEFVKLSPTYNTSSNTLTYEA